MNDEVYRRLAAMKNQVEMRNPAYRAAANPPLEGGDEFSEGARYHTAMYPPGVDEAAANYGADWQAHSPDDFFSLVRGDKQLPAPTQEDAALTYTRAMGYHSPGVQFQAQMGSPTASADPGIGDTQYALSYPGRPDVPGRALSSDEVYGASVGSNLFLPPVDLKMTSQELAQASFQAGHQQAQEQRAREQMSQGLGDRLADFLSSMMGR